MIKTINIMLIGSGTNRIETNEWRNRVEYRVENEIKNGIENTTKDKLVKRIFSICA